MHRLLLLLIGCLIATLPCSVSGNNTPERLGQFTKRYPSGRVMSVAVGYRKGDQQVRHGGEVTLYDMPGNQVRTRIQYVHGRRHGRAEEWYASGVSSRTGFFHEDKQHGPWEYFREDGTKSFLVTYEHGLKNGASRAWNESETLITETHFLNDKKHGLQTIYYPSGTVRARLNWQADVPHGSVESFYPNGQLQDLSDYVQGVRHGRQRRHLQDGQLLLSATWHEGKLNGQYMERDESGAILNSGIYRNDEPWEGSFRAIGFRENQYWLDKLSAGQIVDTVFHEDGKPKTGVVIEEHAKDYPRRRIVMKDGRKEGDEHWFYINGQLWKQMTWRDGKLHGSYTEYFENGQLAWLVFLVNGKREGVESRYNMRGELIAEGEYRNDRPWDGIFVITTPEGEDVLKKVEKGVPVREFGGKPLSDASPRLPRNELAPTEASPHADEPLPGEGGDWLPAPEN